MPQPTLLAYTDIVPPLTQELLVCLGRPQVLPDLPAERVHIEEDVVPETILRLARIDPTRMARGLVIVTSRAQYQRQPKLTLAAQKLLLHLFIKYVRMPLTSTRVPDPMDVRGAEMPPEFLHDINLHRNTPLHLRHCLVDKLRDEQVGLPCLLLLPGPGLNPLRPLLPELARRYLIVTISRVLPVLRELGLVPDVLVQLDTIPIQQHFHHPDELFPRSILLSLSMAPIQGFATRFRHLFFIDSFNLSVLPNPTRIRESWLSSMLACLGSTEVLHASKVLMAGADLRIYGLRVYQWQSHNEDPNTLPPYDDPLICHDSDLVVLPDALGRRADSTAAYMAVTTEAEQFAQEIHASTGTTFHPLSTESLLDPETFPPMTVEDALRAPELDRQVFLDKCDRAARGTERINLRSLRAKYTRQMVETKGLMEVFTALRANAPQMLQQHPCLRYVRTNLPWFCPTGEDGQRLLAENLTGELFEAIRFARNVAAAHLLASTGKPVPVLCTAEEEAAVQAVVKRLWPDWTWRFLGVRYPGTGRPEPSAGAVDLATFYDWAHVQDVILVAPQFADEFRYVFPLVREDNCLELETLRPYLPRDWPAQPASPA